MSAESVHPSALRLIFQRRGDQIELVDAIAVDMVVPPTDDLDVDDTQYSGFAVRLYEGGGSLVYRRAMFDPLRREVEAPTGDPDRPWELVPVDLSIPVRFDIVVPNGGDDAEREIELVASPPRQTPDRPRGMPNPHREAMRSVARMKVPPGRAAPSPTLQPYYDEGGEL